MNDVNLQGNDDLPNDQYVKMNKASDNDWFLLESNSAGTRWHGKCWYIHNYRKYEFDVQFEVSEWNGYMPTDLLIHCTDSCNISKNFYRN